MVSGKKSVLIALLLYFLLSAGVTAELSNEEYHQLPRLFHLDDYDKCLSKRDGVYCLGDFQLTPLQEPHYLYNWMKIHSEDRYNYNRTYIHRGYCLSSRCPSSERNHTLRFEECANASSQKHGLRATLRNFQYCITHDEINVVTPQTSEQAIFVQVVYAILALNVIGTVYDVMSGDAPEKNKFLIAWSVPANWKRLMYISEGGDPRFTALQSLQGARIIGLALTTYAHARVFHFSIYTYNPDSLEKLTRESEGVLLSNGSLLVHSFIILTSFLTSYQFLIYSQKQPLGFHMLPMCVIKRIIRILPVHMLVVGYASTWWATARAGPLVSVSLGEYSRVCRQKFWTHLFFLNNVVDKENICLLPTWYLAVDLHLFVLACSLTLIMWKHRHKAMQIYGACFIFSLVLSIVICYINEWKPMIMLSTCENLKRLFNGVESFSHFYTSTWGALPACFLGLFMGHLHFELQEKGFKGNDHKWFVVMSYIAIPLGVLWQINAGKYATQQSSTIFATTFIAIDRLVFFTLMFFIFFGLTNVEGPVQKFYAWSKWQIMARMSLAVILIHWIVNLVITTRPTVYGTSALDGMVDWLATVAITYSLAVPVTVLCEIPTQRFFNALLS